MCNLLTVDIKSGEDMLVEGDSEGSHRGRAGAKEGLTEGEDTGEELPQHLVNRERQGEEVDMMAKLSYSDKSSPVPRLYSFHRAKPRNEAATTTHCSMCSKGAAHEHLREVPCLDLTGEQSLHCLLS